MSKEIARTAKLFIDRNLAKLEFTLQPQTKPVLCADLLSVD